MDELKYRFCIIVFHWICWWSETLSPTRDCTLMVCTVCSAVIFYSLHTTNFFKFKPSNAHDNSLPPRRRSCHHKLVLFKLIAKKRYHYGDVIMGAIASQITSLTIVHSTVYSDADQRKHQSSASLAFVRGPVNSPHKWPVTRKMLPFDDVITCWACRVKLPSGECHKLVLMIS